jgi:hypothetical protein
MASERSDTPHVGNGVPGSSICQMRFKSALGLQGRSVMPEIMAGNAAPRQRLDAKELFRV